MAAGSAPGYPEPVASPYLATISITGRFVSQFRINAVVRRVLDSKSSLRATPNSVAVPRANLWLSHTCAPPLR